MLNRSVTGVGAAAIDVPDFSLSARAEIGSEDGRAYDHRGGGVPRTLLMLLPGALVVYMGFNAGGFFPGTPALGALILLQVLLLRLLLADRPIAGFGAETIVATGALAIYTLVALISASWSQSASRALLAFDRDLFYLLALIVFASVGPRPGDLRWLIRGLALSFAILCVAGLISRVAPDLWHTAPSIANQRLSYPLTYWNALGIIAALGIVLSLHLTCAVDEPWAVRALAAALVPLQSTTLYFTFSRGAMASCVIGVIVYMIAARPRALLSGLVAVLPASAVTVKVAYDAGLLASSAPTTPAAIVQAHRVALALGIGACVASLLRVVLCRWLDPIDVAGTTWGRACRRTRVALASFAALVAVGIVLVVVTPQSLAGDWHQFLNGATTPTSDMRQRLSTVSSDGRTQLWRVAIDAFDARPLDGYGAGTYQLLWQRREPVHAYTVNAHSLYFETMAELGLLGLVPLVCLVLVVLFGLFRRCRGDARPIYTALAATALVSFVHAGVDWDWQMPATMLGLFAAAGLGLSTRVSSRSWTPGRRARTLLGFGAVAAMVLPIMIMASQARLHRAELALVSGRCDAASSSALAAIGWMPDRPEPYEILGYCDLQRGFRTLGIEAMREAISRDPSNWEGYYSLALAQASAGLDPRVAAGRALQMNPKDPLTIQAAHAFAATSPSGWPRVSSVLRSDALASGELSVEPA